MCIKMQDQVLGKASSFTAWIIIMQIGSIQQSLSCSEIEASRSCQLTSAKHSLKTIKGW